ncbi:MAG: M67 family metallopeptidase [Dehalococcoidia bacterium]
MKLERSFADEIIAHAREDAPNECCGIIAGNDGSATKLYRAVNAEASPYRYNVDPKDLLKIYRDIDDHGWDVLAIYHSHTHTEAYPSPTDVRLAAWPEAYYLIVSLANEKKPVLRAFRIKGGVVDEAKIEVN